MLITKNKATSINTYEESTSGALLHVEEQGEHVLIVSGHKADSIDDKVRALDVEVWFDKQNLGELIKDLQTMHERMTKE